MNSHYPQTSVTNGKENITRYTHETTTSIACVTISTSTLYLIKYQWETVTKEIRMISTECNGTSNSMVFC